MDNTDATIMRLNRIIKRKVAYNKDLKHRLAKERVQTEIYLRVIRQMAGDAADHQGEVVWREYYIRALIRRYTNRVEQLEVCDGQ